ncbi:MAG: YDG domain-containing protein, partial [Sideroxydans sp.]|nr:YDG domain-containing protein [Sideroxydans sp.]
TANKVTVSGVSLTGITGSQNSAISDYVLAATSVDVAATITAKSVTLSASKTYDGTTSLTGAVTLGTGIAGETLTYSGATANDAHVATVNKYINALTLADATDLSGGLASNYQLPTLNAANAAVTISTKALTSTASIGGTLSKVYDGTTSATAASVSGSVSGAVSGDTLSLDTSGVTLAYNSAHVVGANSISASGNAGYIISSTVGSLSSDYSFSAPTIADATASITEATLTLSLTNTGVSKTYDGTLDAPVGFTPSWGFSGLVTGDTAASVTSTGAAYNSKDVATANKVTVSGVSLTGISGNQNSAISDYVLAATSVDVAATITAKSLTVSGLAAANKTYDGTTDVNVTNWGSVSAGIGSETLVLDHGGAAFADANANTGKTVTASGYTLANGSNGGQAGNYTLSATSATTTADIAKAMLTVTANDDAKFVLAIDNPAYNGVSYSGFVHGESSTVLTGVVGLSRSNASIHSAGNYNGVLVPDTSGLTANNYNFQTQNGNYTVVGSGQMLVRVNNTSSTYGSASNYSVTGAEYYNGSSVVMLSAIVDNGNGNFTINDGVGGSATFTLTPINANLSGAGKTAVGAYQLGASGVSTLNATNFGNTVTVVGTETVTAKAVSASASGVSKVYDGTTSMTGVSIDLANLEINDTVTVSGSGAFGSKNAGNGNVGYTISGITLGGNDGGNYYLTGGSSFSGSNGTILQRSLTGASISGVTTTYGTAASAGSVSFDNIVSGDTVVSTASIDSAAYSTSNNLKAGSYTQTASALSGADAANYDFAGFTSTANYTVAKLALTGAAINSVSTTYGTAASTGSVSFSNIISGDTVVSTASIDSAAYSTSNNLKAGSYTQTASALSGADAANYDFAGFTSAANYIVGMLAITATPSNLTKVYDSTTAMPGVVLGLNGLVVNDGVTAAGTGSFATHHVGSGLGYSITGVALSGADAANYSLSSTSLTGNNGEITQAPLTISGITASDKVYNADTAATVSTAGAVYGGLFSGDNVTVAATGVFGDQNVGTNKVVTLSSSYTGSNVGDYAITDQTSTMADITSARPSTEVSNAQTAAIQLVASIQLPTYAQPQSVAISPTIAITQVTSSDAQGVTD